MRGLNLSLRSQRLGGRETTASTGHILRQELDAQAGGSIAQTYFLHDVIDPGRCAVAEVRALGVPVAQMGHAHVRGHACKTSKANRVRQGRRRPRDGHTLGVWSGARGGHGGRGTVCCLEANLMKRTRRRCKTALVALQPVILQ